MKQEAVLTVPAGEEWALVLRMAASGVGALYDLALDVIDDLGAAMDESLDLLLHQSMTPQNIEMHSFADEEGLHVNLSAKERVMAVQQNPADPEISRMIIGTLVSRVDLEQDAGGVFCVHMTLPRKE